MKTIQFWYIVLAVFVFGLLIFIHELGHYLCARACGVGINEFAIGMGPKIFSWISKKTGTRYSVRALPIGGYVSMVGEDEESPRDDSLGNCSVWKRISIVIAGPLMNLLLGFLATVFMVTSVGELYGTQVDYPDNGHVQISDGSGLEDGDVILKVGRVRVHTRSELAYEIMRQGTEPVAMTVLRNGTKLTVEGVMFPTFEEKGVLFGGIDFYADSQPLTLPGVVKHTLFRAISMVKMIVDSFVDLFAGKYGVETMSGPVGITQTMGEAAAGGLSSFLYIFVLITMNLGVFNLLPVPALDGGRLLFLLIEAVTRKPVNKTVESYIHLVGLLLLFGLIIFVTLNDILRLF